MKKELITFETARLAKEKGFDWGVRHYYGSPMNPHICYAKDDYGIPRDYNSKDKGNPSYYISAPTQSLLQRWLREVHNIHIRVEYNNPFYIGCFLIPDYKARYNLASRTSETYEDALEKALIKALKEIK